MRILHMIPGLANSSGPTHIVVNLAEHQARLGCKVAVYHLQYKGVKPVVPACDLVESREFPITFYERWGYSRSLGRTIKQSLATFDVVHIHSVWMYPNMPASRTAQKLGIPYLISPQGSFMSWQFNHHGLRKRIYLKIAERSHLDHAAALHAVCEQEANAIRQFGFGAPIFVLPNGVSIPAEFNALPGGHDPGLRGKRAATEILYLGRLHPIKGLDLLARAFGSVARRRDDVHLVLAGGDKDSGYKNEIVELLSRENVLQKTTFTGEVRGRDKWAAYRSADVFVLPSYSEGLPVAALEALACGKPVVITEGCNLPDVATSRAGFVVPSSADHICHALLQLIDEESLRQEMGRNGKSLVGEKYPWDRIARKLLHVYENIVSGYAPGAGLDEFN